ncbi:uncharacterized protein LOC129605185 [Condylostylus longicornis]|uniref:uncharacterized protein LOC129605185 n=1 Tax=Condylostylus longicornis TaxID=2530218 RepID=UPI00244DC8DE|nr:uncharacterized protein LOC129605185 [Condylostylus longicornis]
MLEGGRFHEGRDDFTDCGGLQRFRYSSEKEKFADDDSDMLMEPDEIAHVSVIRSESRQVYPSSTEYTDDVTSQYPADSHSQAAQSYYPSFYREQNNSPPHGHSRPFTNSDNSGSGKFSVTPRGFDPAILGSGDFGVIRGGTFYPEDEIPYHANDEANEYNQFYADSSNNNGHGRPQSDEYVQKYTYPEEQFANFRDFADINTSSDYASSHFVVVYAAKTPSSSPSTSPLESTSSSSSSHHSNPKNIFEQLELLDKEKAEEEELQKKKNRLSKHKTKLANTKLEKKYKKKLGPKDLDYEPLLALS